MAESKERTPNQQGAKVLFVCLGNICRSPTAEAVFTTVAERRGVADTMTIDSCGTGGGSPDWYREGGWSYHEGDAADARMRDHALRRGITLTSRSRPLTPQDLTTFDFIVAMVGVLESAQSTDTTYMLTSPGRFQRASHRHGRRVLEVQTRSSIRLSKQGGQDDILLAASRDL